MYSEFSDLCRRKKIKCDGTIPICGNCQAFNLECAYKDTTKKVSGKCFEMKFISRIVVLIKNK